MKTIKELVIEYYGCDCKACTKISEELGNKIQKHVLGLMKEFHTTNKIALAMWKELKARIEGK